LGCCCRMDGTARLAWNLVVSAKGGHAYFNDSSLFPSWVLSVIITTSSYFFWHEDRVVCLFCWTAFHGELHGKWTGMGAGYLHCLLNPQQSRLSRYNF